MIDPGLASKVAVVTGGNSGIGTAIAKALAAQGALVVIHYLDVPPKDTGEPYSIEFAIEGEAGALKVAEDIRQAGGQATLLSGDLADLDTIPKIFAHAESTFGPVSVLVNNAAHCELPDTILFVTEGSIDRHFRVNTRAAVLLMSEFIRRFRKQLAEGPNHQHQHGCRPGFCRTNRLRCKQGRPGSLYSERSD